MKEHVVDRSKWAEGEWDREPQNRIDFVHAGFACFMLRNHFGAWCGYVGVPSDHPAYGKDYNDDLLEKIDVHGGLTYAEKCAGVICHVPEPGMPDDVWWLGFDTAHYGDVCPMNLHWAQHDETYKNIKYVTDEIKSLADQLKEMK